MKGQQEIRLIFGSVKLEVIKTPGRSPAPELEATIALGPKEQLILRGHQVEDFLQCIEALYYMKRRGRDP